MSTLWRRAQCPGSYGAEQGLSDLERAEAAEGTDWHRKVSEAIMRWKKGEAYGLAEEDDLAQFCIDYFERVAIESRASARDVLPEYRCELYSGGLLLTWGTCDLLIIDRTNRELHVFDWKFGYRAADPLELTTQVAAYGEAARQALRFEGDLTCHVLNPRLRKEYTILPPPHIMVDVVENIIENAHTSTTLRPGDHCRYCRALGLCEATQGEAQEVAALAEPEALRAVAAYPPGRIEALLEVVPRVEAAAKAVRARAKALLAQDPCALSSWRLATKKGRRAMSIADALRATQDILDPKELLACCSVSVPELERAVTSSSETAKEGRAVWRERCAQYVSQPTYEELRRDESARGPAGGNNLPGIDSP